MANKLQNTILIIADEVDRICKKHGIKYDMDGGTLLGAVRHKGFIPWDDDFDVGMKRCEYEKFLKACEKELDAEKYTLQTFKNRDYAFAFSKIHLNGTELKEEFSKDADVHRGIFLDVFPYDNLPDGKIERKVFLIQNHILKNLIWVKGHYGTESQKKKLSYFLFILLGAFIPIEKLKRKREKLLRKYNNIETEECFTSDYPMYHLKNRWFKDLIDIQFEDRAFPGFKSYDEYLKTIFGDYMELPPEDKRMVHTTEDVDFGPY